MEKYDRIKFLEHWPIHGGINYHELFLAKVPTDPFVVCPYTGKSFNPSEMQLDHVVPLEFFYAKTGRTDHVFALDMSNLLLVSAESDESKGPQGIVDWIPPFFSFQSKYAKIWRFVCEKYGIPLTKKEDSQIHQLIRQGG